MNYILTFIFSLCLCAGAYAQDFNDYKYILVPDKFSFSNKNNEYGLNTATKQQLRSYGFEAYLKSDEFPFNLKQNICNILDLSVEQESSLLRTKIKLVLSDCEGRPVYISQMGESKEKLYQKAYVEAFREALISFKTLEFEKPHSENEAHFEVTESENVQNEIVKEHKINSDTKDFEKVSTKITEDSSPKTVLRFISIDGLYKVYQNDDNLKFYEGLNEIGNARSVRNSSFTVETTQFSGEAFFRKGDLILNRYIKGVGKVEMVFKLEN
ncbi:hypothetical protein [Dokdonia sp. Hel_I_53]|uniref:hypothetical protein n=1 Tax=Dokdonia sp. Hel_I_53 TaxID=1566287 RepID=UPI00119A8CCC|nr:hypothetical protein [Dokdonia sp. Hel_I_53]TVZ52064.1 hypothetical protein OD90_1227 [Dokdonia sp. Hel_I_53]